MVGQYRESWLKLEEALGGRTALKDAVTTKDGDVGGTGYRIHTPTEAAKGGALPVGLYTHGGGFVMGDLSGEDALCRAVSERSGCILVSVDYRLAPEHKAPAQLMDSLSVLKWVHVKMQISYGGDPDQFFTIGGSAGGGLALGVANRMVSHPEEKDGVRGVVAMVPLTLHPDHVPDEYKSDYNSYTENATNVPVIDHTSMMQFYEYTGVDPKDKSYFTALDTDNLRNFPPTYICTCEFDPLRDDGQVIAKALQKNGVSVKTDYNEGLPHYFWIFPQVPESQTFMAQLFAGTKWVIDQM